VIIPAYSSFSYTAGSVAKTIGLNLLLRGWFADAAPFSHNPGVGVNGSLWSIPYEFWCYLGVLGLGVTGLLRVQRRHLILLGLVASLAARAFMDISGKKPGGGFIGDIFGWSYLWSKVLPCFLGGMLVYQYREILPRRRWIAVAAVLTTVAVCRLPISESSKSALVGVVFPPAITYVVFYAAFSRQWFDAARYGDFSYGTYLYAFPIEQMIRASYGTSLPFWAYVPIVIVLSLAAGVASWYLVEHWFLTKRPKLAKEGVGTGVSGAIQR
jgi:peptidoglycan/LPS O-acetylase OafA/YrhL